MLQILFNIADNDNDSPYGPLIFMAIIVVISIISALAKAVGKSRQQRGQPPPGAKPAGERPPSVDEFLQQIRKMAKGETGPADRPEQTTGPQQPPSRPAPPPPPPRPVAPLQAGQRPTPPPPPPRPLRPRPADQQPLRQPPPPPPRPAVPRAPAAKPAERPALRPRIGRQPDQPAPAKVSLESVSALTETASLLAAAAPKTPPKRRRAREGLKLPKKAVAAKPAEAAVPPAPATAMSPAELRAALTRRLAAGPSALREAVLLGEVLGQPIGMRRRRAHRPGGPSRLI